MALLLGLVAMGAVAALSTMGNTIGGSEQANTASGALGGSSEPSLIETTSGRLWDPSSGAVVSLGGGAVRSTAPTDTLQGNVESDVDSRVWPEAGPITLDADLRVVSIDGAFAGATPHDQTVPAGTEVCSYYVQTDRESNGYTEGTATFKGREVLGVVTRLDELEKTDDLLGADGTYYGGGRGMENHDKLILDRDAGTVSWSIWVAGEKWTDDFRVITTCG